MSRTAQVAAVWAILFWTFGCDVEEGPSPGSADAGEKADDADADAGMGSESTCNERCGESGPGCGCDVGCEARGNCCPDAAMACSLGTIGDGHLAAGDPDCEGTIVEKDHYVICHDDVTLVPRWTAYYITALDLLADEAYRMDNFHAEPELPSGERAEVVDYRRSGYDRGHMAPAGDFTRSTEAMTSTFSMANMAPQAPGLNRGVWRQIEAGTRDLVLGFGRGWVFTGNLFLDSNLQRLDEPTQTLGSNKVGVPTHCFKALLNEHSDGTYTAFAFVTPNEDPDNEGPRDFLVSVDELEDLTGMDFFSALEDSEEAELEAAIPDWSY